MPDRPAHQDIQVGPVTIRFRLDADETGEMLTMFEFTVPPQARVPVPHSHDGFDETLYGLDGVLSWTVGGNGTKVGPGQVLFIPRGVVHHFENRSAAPARALSVITPGLLGPAFFQEMAEVLAAGGPPDVPRLMAVMQRHGLRPAPPAK